jgi:tetratricopeptide (TPR) repeat protein
MSGSWSLAAARAIANISELALLEHNGQVLRVPSEDADPRFTIPELVRHMLLAALVAAGEEHDARRAHAQYYLALVERERPPYDALARQHWLHTMAQEAANLELALAWSLAHQPPWALRLSAALGPLWTRRGTPRTGVVQLAAALDQTGPDHAQDRAAAFAWLGLLYFHRSDLSAARASYETSLAAYHALNDQEGIAWVLRELARAQVDPLLARANLRASEQLCRALGDDIGVGAALNELGNLERWHGNYIDAQELHEQSLARFRAAGDLPGTVEALYSLGLALASQGKVARAQAVYTEGVALSRAIGDRLHMAWCTLNLGMVESDMGFFDLAEQRLAEAEGLFQVLGDQSGSAWCLFNQGQTAMRREQTQQAAALFTGAHTLFQTIGDPWGQAWTLAHLGDALRALGDLSNARHSLAHSAQLLRQQQSVGGIPRLVESCARLILAEHGALPYAVHLFAAAANLMHIANEQRRSADQTMYNRHIDTLHTALGDTAFATAWAAGAHLTADQALDAALGMLTYTSP